MKKKQYLFISCFVLIAFGSIAQGDKAQLKADTATVNKLIAESKELAGVDLDKSIEIGSKAVALAQELDFKKGEAAALKAIGIAYYFQNNFVTALTYWNQSLEVSKELNDEQAVAYILGNIGAIYTKQEDDVKALEYHLKSLRLAEKIGDKKGILSANINVGGVYFNKVATRDRALEYLLKSLALAEAMGNNDILGIASENIGEIYFARNKFDSAIFFFDKSLKVLGDGPNSAFAYNGLGKVYREKGSYNKALDYHRKAVAIAEKVNEEQLTQSYLGIANVFTERNDYISALQYYKKAEEVAQQQKAYPDLKDLYGEMATAYHKLKDYDNAFQYRTKLDHIKDTLDIENTRKKLGLVQFEYNLQKKQGEVDLLTKDKQLQLVELQKQKLVKNSFLAGLILILFIAFIIYRNYKAKARINKILDKQKEQIEQLLLNILPSEVATELQETGQSTPRNYESVSVLFTDFKGFTTLADKMSPRELVEELNTCFVAFDNIIERNNLEKIKTIGDSYMCAGGIPTPDDQHIYNIVKASLEIQQYVVQNNMRRQENSLPPWDVRIGIHVGPVVAGVVGKKKYAYDIWGSTVNIASRMESNGEPGRVNISASVYELIKDKYACSYRGKIYAKNVGEIDMYFVDQEPKKHRQKLEPVSLNEGAKVVSIS